MKPKMRLLVFAFLAAILLQYVDSKSLEVQLQPSWSTTTLLSEASEFFADSSFWTFAEEALKSQSTCLSPQDEYNRAMAIAETLPNWAGNQRLLQLALSARVFSPRVAAMYSMATEYGANTTEGPFVWIGGEIVNTLDQLKNHIENLRTESSEEIDTPLFSFDHEYASGAASSASSPVAVLYGSLCSPAATQPFHSALREAASAGKIRYVFRHCDRTSGSPMGLQGYGVELQIKNLEYKAFDDSKAVAESVSDDGEAEDESAGPALNVADVQELGLQAAQRVMQSSDPLESLLDTVQNFPLRVSALSRTKVTNEQLRQEVQSNQMSARPGDSFLLLNGRPVESAASDPTAFFELLRSETRLADTLRSLHVAPQHITELLHVPVRSPGQDSDALAQHVRLNGNGNNQGDGEKIFSSPRFDVRSELVTWLNDLEKDPMYAQMPSKVTEILRTNWYGQPRFVRRNMFNALFLVDPGTSVGLRILANLVNFRNNNIPVRLGAMPVSPNAANSQSGPALFEVGVDGHSKSHGHATEVDLTVSDAIVRVFEYVKAKSNADSAFAFLSELAMTCTDRDPTMRDVDSAWSEAQKRIKDRSSITQVVRDAESAERARRAAVLVKQKGFTKFPVLVMNGLVFEQDEVDNLLVRIVMNELPTVRALVASKKIKDSTPDILANILEASNAYKRFSTAVFSAEDDTLRFVPVLPRAPATADLWSKLHLYSNGDEIKTITTLLFVDLATETGARAAIAALSDLESGESTARTRLAILHNTDTTSPLAARILQSLASSGTKANAHQLLTAAASRRMLELLAEHKMPHELTPSLTQAISDALGAINEGQKKAVDSAAFMSQIAEPPHLGAALCKHLGLTLGENVVVVNGRVVALAGLSTDDLGLLQTYEHNERAARAAEAVDSVSFVDIDADDITNDLRSDLVCSVVSLLSYETAQSKSPRVPMRSIRAFASTFSGNAGAITSEGDGSGAYEVIGLLDPLSEAAQKCTPFLLMLRDHFGARVRVHLNPVLSLSSMPLKSFYRQVLEPRLSFDDTTGQVIAPRAFFSRVPAAQVFTLNMHVPEPWLVEATYARYDLDNVRMGELPAAETTLTAVYTLKHIMITGSCVDLTAGSPPRGLQLNLGNRQRPHVVDTLVMSNFGYFQLKANPSVWSLSLAPGRASSLFLIQALGGSRSAQLVGNPSSAANGMSADPTVRIPITSFSGEHIVLNVIKRPGKEHVELLSAEDEGAEGSGFWSTVTSFFGSHKQAQQESANAEPTVHIFSIASGHLYERFLKIMMLSVRNNTSGPIKFWFVANFLSPQFKEVIPHMAARYNFSYDLVTYKWPSWLHKQTEKQRLIWAYKVLFLDVLFPLDTDKIIFVDADQVVRADLRELYNLDLEGAPLGYTPFCESREETLGFQFWRSGYWKEHLRGRPYHISALYVVDLKRFRQMAAGDQLRYFYETLSRDPNSLANLDQDLPNYAQHVVPIHSLPQSWLWCETWCDDDSKKEAKTIDLCNNPLTKTPKLENAKRIIEEWVDYDSEWKEFEKSLQL